MTSMTVSSSESSNQFDPRPVEQRQQAGLFLGGDLEKGADMPAGNNQRVPRRDREAIADGQRPWRLLDDALGWQGAKWAAGRHY